MKDYLTFVAAVCAGIVVAGFPGQAQVRQTSVVSDVTLQNSDPDDWLNWRRTLDGWGYSPLDQIHRDNVDRMQLAWSWGLEPGVSQTTPLVYVAVGVGPSGGGSSWATLIPLELFPEKHNPRAGNGVYVFALP
jgi:hypothetical protein